MRFSSGGPRIPNELIEERDRGNVVFFCGAGVSFSAGMPSFLELCRHVIDELGVSPNAEARAMLQSHYDKTHPAARMPLDQIFNLLQQEYRRGEIDYHIKKCLMPKPNTPLKAHKTILHLSRSADDRPQVVTTNFDYLFERACNSKKLFRFVPPRLPDLTADQNLDGLVYLHGRINGNMRPGDGQQGFVVSSSDFGRAYLAEGWATRFVRDLLERYTVVLLGYSANDPPVQYLLQGLHTRMDGHQNPTYAFVDGTNAEEATRWQHMGVLPMAYERQDDDHSRLWNTLEAWAQRSDDPSAWRSKVINLARKGPRALTGDERGQVVSLIQTNAGTKAFADAEPPPSGEWLCVFDAELRYANPRPEFDPLEEYGLDDDPPRSPESFDWSDPERLTRGQDFLCLGAEETNDSLKTRLAGVRSVQVDRLTRRLRDVSRWIGKVVHEPVVLWWAAKYLTIHPEVLSEIERGIRQTQSDLPACARKAWQLLIEALRQTPKDEMDDLWYETLGSIESDGWTPSALRSFARSTQPCLKVNFSLTNPSESNWSKIHVRDVINLDVGFLSNDHIDSDSIPEDAVPRVYQILRGHLERAAELLADIQPLWWKTKTFYPEDLPGDGSYVDDASAYLHWFRSILDRMINIDAELIRHDCALWLTEEPFFFDKLRIYIWSLSELIHAEEVADGLLKMSDQAFWEGHFRRELLMLLKSRWSKFSENFRTAVENRISDGDPGLKDQEGEDNAKRRSIVSAEILGWLVTQDCALTSATLERLGELRSAVPNWNPKWDETAASSGNSFGGRVRTDSDASLILKLPLDQVVPVARENTRKPWGELVDYRPFDGLVAIRPVRAISALTCAARRGQYPTGFWRSVMQNWPEESSLRLVRLFAKRLARLPQKYIFELRYQLFQWSEKHLQRIAQHDLQGALRIYDTLLEKLFAQIAESTEHSSDRVSAEEEKADKARRISDAAITSPCGSATHLLLIVLNDIEPEKGQGIRDSIRWRLEGLIAKSGECRDHVVHVITRDISWLNYIDPAWVSETVVPWLELDHELAIPAWSGFLHSTKLPRPELFSRLKSNFLAVIVQASRDSWDGPLIQRAHELLVQGCLWHQDGEKYISYGEARAAIRDTDDTGRVYCLNYLARVVREDNKQWRRFGKPFLENAWPKELSCQSESTTKQFALLAEFAEELFPEVVKTVIPLMGPASLPISLRYLSKRDDDVEGTEIAIRFPEHTLSLLDALVKDDPRQAPFQLDPVLELIGDSRPALRQDSRWRRLKSILHGEDPIGS